MSNRLRMQLDQVLDAAEEEEVDMYFDPKRFYFLRPSSFPYCGLRRFLEAPKKMTTPSKDGLARAYFTRVGKTVHSVFQKFVGMGGAIVGDWKCTNAKCKHIERFTTYARCTKCGSSVKYLELEVKMGRTVIGHLDGLWRLTPKKGLKSIHIPIDYKTTSIKKIWKHRDTGTQYPYKGNVAQIEAYVPLLEEQYKIFISHWALVYAARDVPFRSGRVIILREVNATKKKRLLRKLKKTIKIHRRMLQSDTREDVAILQKHKLCKSKQDYQEKYLDPYNPCPYLDACFRPAMDGIIDKALKKNKKVYPLIETASPKIRREMRL
jgi:hypothetical protein